MQNEQDPSIGGGEGARPPTNTSDQSRGQGSRHRIDLGSSGSGPLPTDPELGDYPRTYNHSRSHACPGEHIIEDADGDDGKGNNNNYEDAHVEIKRKKKKGQHTFVEVIGDFFANNLLEEGEGKKDGKDLDENNNFSSPFHSPKASSSFGHFEQLWRYPEVHEAYVVYTGEHPHGGMYSSPPVQNPLQEGGRKHHKRRHSVQSFDAHDGGNMADLARQAKREEAEKQGRPATAAPGGMYGVTGVPGPGPVQPVGVGGPVRTSGGYGAPGVPPPGYGAPGPQIYGPGVGRGAPVPGGMVGAGGPGGFGAPPPPPGYGAAGVPPPGYVAPVGAPGAPGFGPAGGGGAAGGGPGGRGKRARSGSMGSDITDLENMLDGTSRPPDEGPEMKGGPKKTTAERWVGMSPVAKVMLIIILLLSIGIIGGIVYQVTVVLQGYFGQD